MNRNLILSVIVALLLLPLSLQARNYTVTLTDATPQATIEILKKSTGYNFVYRQKALDKIRVQHISESFKDASLNDILDRIFVDKLGLDYEIIDKTVIILPPGEKKEVNATISGVVLDEEGEPLPGASVLLKGTTNGVSTNIDGEFSLNISGKHPVLLVSYVGMHATEYRLNDSNTSKPLRITLKANAAVMEEVVVTGYQNIKRENATGAYQTITAEDMDRRYTGSLTENLEGKIPGLVSYNNGVNGGGENAITIRGMSSFQAETKPLVVVDGLPIEGSIESVNPYDIANITVLKDAAAASIYGTRASSGIIVITTKQANSPRVTVDFNADLTVYEKNNYDNMGWASASEIIELEKYQFSYMKNDPDQSTFNNLMNWWDTNRRSRISPVSKLLIRNHLGELSEAEMNSQFALMSKNDFRKEYQNAMESNRFLQQYNVAIRSQGKNSSSSVVVNYKRDNNGIYREHNDAISVHYRGDFMLSKWFNLSLGVNVLSERAKTHLTSNMEYTSISSFRPYDTMYNDDGTPRMMQAGVDPENPALSNAAYGLKSVYYNFIDERNMNWQRDRRTNIRTYIRGLFNILNGWTASTQFQYEDIYFKRDELRDGESYQMRYLYNLYTSQNGNTITHNIPDGGWLGTTTSEGAFYTFRAQTQYQKEFKDKHRIDILGGFEYRQIHNKENQNLLLGYDDQTQTNNNGTVDWSTLRSLWGRPSVLGQEFTMQLGPTPGNFSSSDILHRFYSIYFTGNYVYDSRYAISGSWRVDKTDLFGADPKYRGRPLWSIGASWNIHNENFLNEQTWISVLKPRFSYGLTGNIDSTVSSFLTATIYTNTSNGGKTASLDTPPNDQLRWEKTSTWNVGLDFAFWNYRISGSFDYYYKKGSDLLTVTDLDPSTGWNSLTINNGEMVNHGVELQLNGNIIRQNNRNSLGLRAGFNLAINNNKVTKVLHEPASGEEALRVSTLHKGYPINSLFSYRYAGLEHTGNVTSFTWFDKNGEVHNSTLNSSDFTPDDIVYSGSLDPKYVMSFNPEITYHGLSLSAMMTYYGGHVMRSETEKWTGGGMMTGYGGTAKSSYLDYWKAQDNSQLPPNGYLGGTNLSGSYDNADTNVVPADYLKIRNIVLGYLFPNNISKHLGLSELRLRVQMNNIATWSKNKLGLDPEAIRPDYGYNLTKAPRSYTFSILVKI